MPRRSTPPPRKFDLAQEIALGIDLLPQDETGAVTVTIPRDAFTVQPFVPAGGPARTFSDSDDAHPRR